MPINTKEGGLDAKGSAIYTDANVTYTMDVQALKVDGNTAWFVGQVTSVTVPEPIRRFTRTTGFSTRWLTAANPELV